MSLNDADLKLLAKMLAEKYWMAISLALKTGEDLSATRHKHAESMAELTAGWNDARVVELHELYANELNLLSSAEEAGHNGESQAFQDNGSDFISKKVDRSSVREYVRRDSESLRACAMAGGNVYQLSLDQQDIVNEHIAGMPSADAAAFLKVYTEELEASAHHSNLEADRLNKQADLLNAQTAASTYGTEVVGRTIGVILLVVFFIVILSNLRK